MSAMAHLIEALGKLGDLEAQKEIQLQLFDAKRETLGDADNDTYMEFLGLISTLRELGEHEAARHIQEQMIESLQDDLQENLKTLGITHPDTINDMLYLSYYLGDYDLGDHVDRREAMRNVHELIVEARRQSLVDQHEDTIRAMEEVAGILDDLGEHEAEQKLREQIIEAKAAAGAG
jgi:tetratricopeptide (TPR) repeat protein